MLEQKERQAMKLLINEMPFNNDTNKIELAITGNNLNKVHELQKALSEGKQLDVEIKIHRKRRSLNANAAMWAMLNEMAVVLNKTAEEVYEDMLRFYGYETSIAIVPEALESVEKVFRVVEKIGYTYQRGYKMLVLRVWFGTSNDVYDTKVFARLLDGIIQEAKELGVEYISQSDRDLVLSTYEEDKIRS